VLDAKYPGWHCWHVVPAVVLENVPTGQFLHTPPDASEKVPRGQSVQVVEPEAEDFPGRQDEHVLCPVVLLKEPGSHGVQTVEPWRAE
jgi:hypothetical protein